MRLFFEKSLKELQLEKENENYKEKIKALQQENVSLREELELTQEVVNEKIGKEESDSKQEAEALPSLSSMIA